MSDVKTILPPNALQFELDAEQVSARIEGLPVDIRTLWRPAECPADHLAWLAWALSVDVWSGAWPDAVKREGLAQSIPLHRVKGTLGAVKRALASVYAETDVVEWWQDASTAHTFKITITPTADLMGATTGPIFSDALVDELRRVVDAAKPMRSHYSLRLRPLSRVTARTAAAASGTDRGCINITTRQPSLAMSPVLRAVAGAAHVSRGAARLAAQPIGLAASGTASVRAGAVARERLAINFREAA